MPSSAEKQREVRRLRYEAYKQLCAEQGVPCRGSQWMSHFAELRRPVRERPLTREEHFAFWRERLTDREIREIGATLTYLTKEGVGFGY